MSKSIDPVDITYSSISGIVTIDNKLYDCSQILQSLSTQGFPLKKYGSSLKIGNQVISPIPSSSNIPISSPGAQNIIQTQFKQLFDEINALKEKINNNSAFENQIEPDPLDSIESLFQSHNDDRKSLNDFPESKNWDNLIQEEETVSQQTFDVGENNLQRKWSNNRNDNYSQDESHPDMKYQTEYFSLGMQPKNRSDGGIQNKSLSRHQFNEVISSDGPVEPNDLLNDSSLEKLTEELVSRIEKNLVCPKCLSNLPNSAYFCSKCGLKVQKKDLKIPEIFEQEFRKE
ncbi:MAG: hypothetical protein ACW981_20415 [Candidatus Hodarchaeales archaeon]|jgi:ribosomal protein L40E